MWNSRRKEGSGKLNIAADKVAVKVVAVIESVQQLFGKTMNKSFEKMSRKKLKWIVCVFVVVCGSYSLYLIGSVLHDAKRNNTFSVEQMYRPTNSDTLMTQSDVQGSLDERSFPKIQVYRLFLDSIKVVNRPLYDQILSEQPGLLDSMKRLEDIYYSQQNSVYEK